MNDTAATKGNMEVMQAYVDGKKIQMKQHGSDDVWLTVGGAPIWNWSGLEYRIRPQTVEEAANEYTDNKYPYECERAAIKYDFTEGVKWGRENPKD